MTAATDNRKYTGVGSNLDRAEFLGAYYGPAAANQVLYTGTLAGRKYADTGNPQAVYVYVADGTMYCIGFVQLGAGQGGDSTFAQNARPVHVQAETGALIDKNAGGGNAITVQNIGQPAWGVDNQTCSLLASDSPGGQCIGMISGIDPVSGQPLVCVDPVLARAIIDGMPPAAVPVTFSATPTFNVALGSIQRIVLTGNITGFTATAGQFDGQRLRLKFVQDGTGSRTLAGTPSNVRWAGSALTLSTGANKVDTLELLWDATLSQWIEAARALNS